MRYNPTVNDGFLTLGELKIPEYGWVLWSQGEQVETSQNNDIEAILGDGKSLEIEHEGERYPLAPYRELDPELRELIAQAISTM